MPSFRVILGIGALRPGTMPSAVLPAAAEAAAALATLEAQSVELVAHEPRIVIRFTADESDHALGIAEAVRAAVEAVAQVTSRRVTRRVGGRWLRIG